MDKNLFNCECCYSLHCASIWYSPMTLVTFVQPGYDSLCLCIPYLISSQLGIPFHGRLRYRNDVQLPYQPIGLHDSSINCCCSRQDSSWTPSFAILEQLGQSLSHTESICRLCCTAADILKCVRTFGRGNWKQTPPVSVPRSTEQSRLNVCLRGSSCFLIFGWVPMTPAVAACRVLDSWTHWTVESRWYLGCRGSTTTYTRESSDGACGILEVCWPGRIDHRLLGDKMTYGHQCCSARTRHSSAYIRTRYGRRLSDKVVALSCFRCQMVLSTPWTVGWSTTAVVLGSCQWLIAELFGLGRSRYVPRPCVAVLPLFVRKTGSLFQLLCHQVSFGLSCWRRSSCCRSWWLLFSKPSFLSEVLHHQD